MRNAQLALIRGKSAKEQETKRRKRRQMNTCGSRKTVPSERRKASTAVATDPMPFLNPVFEY